MFLKYLSEKEIISKELILEALLTQYDCTPSLIKVLKEDGIFNSSELIELISESIENQKTIHEVISLEGRLTKNDLLTLLQKQSENVPSLGKILVSKGYIGREEYDNLLCEYSEYNNKKEDPHKDKDNGEESNSSSSALESVENYDNTEKTSTLEKDYSNFLKTEETQSIDENSDPPISAAALESLKSIEGLDVHEIEKLEHPDENHEEENNLLSYLEFYNDDFQSELLVFANRFRLKGKSTDLEELKIKLISLLDICNVENFKIQGKLIESYITLFNHFESTGGPDNQSWHAGPFSLVGLLWKFRQSLHVNNDEKEVLDDPELKEEYMEHIKNNLMLMKESA